MNPEIWDKLVEDLRTLLHAHRYEIIGGDGDKIAEDILKNLQDNYKVYLTEDSEREFGSHYIYDPATGKSVPMYECKDGKWIQTPEYKKLMETDKVRKCGGRIDESQ